MKDLKTLAQGLNVKGSWIRKGFQDLLNKWAEETAEELCDCTVLVQDFPLDECHENTIFLKRGKSEIFITSTQDFDSCFFNSAYTTDISTADMEWIRELIKELPGVFTAYAKRLKKADLEYQAVLDLMELPTCP